MPTKRSVPILLLLCSLGCARHAVAPSAMTSEMMREDLAEFAGGLASKHANAFHHVTREEFRAAVAELDARIASLDFDAFYAGLDRIANSIGDAHTYVQFPPDDANLAIDIAWFEGEWRVAAIAPGNERALGLRVVAVDDIEVGRVVEILRAFTPADENTTLAPQRIAGFLTSGMLLHGAGITRVRSRARYALVDDAGARTTIEVSTTPATGASWVNARKDRPLSQTHPGEPFWCQGVGDSKTVYCAFSGYAGLSGRSDRLFELLDQGRAEKLVIDLRQNSGGDYTVGLAHVIEPIARRVAINRRGHLFVLVGPNTFSAGMANAAQFRSMTNAILAGELVGEKPNSYQEPREFRLTHSGLVVRYSTRPYRFVETGPNEVRPDQEIVLRWADYVAGRDPVLEWALAQEAK